ncbi:MAG: SH3 domain-containing protein [Clostridia bacterium]|nr:SH3 domain-containing protein [Clostridia bacterium]
MRKRFILVCFICFAFSLLLAAAALGEDMRVTNCSEWVSLRARPSSSGKVLVKVPLDEVVTGCAPYDADYTYAEYNGKKGYILSSYLTPANPGGTYRESTEPVSFADMQKKGKLLMDTPCGSLRVVARRLENSACERLTVGVYRADRSCVWARTEFVYEVGELTSTSVFIAGTEQQPALAIYNTETGLSLYDLPNGRRLWQLGRSKVSLGAGISHAVDWDGTMYICGYYGPHPVAITMDGRVLWQSNPSRDDIIHPHDITIDANGIIVMYEIPELDREVMAVYDRQGKLMFAE